MGQSEFSEVLLKRFYDKYLVIPSCVTSGVVRLTPSWEERPNLGEDQLNFRAISASMDRLDLEINPPTDR